MRNQLLAYLLDDLSSDERSQVVIMLRQDPLWRAELKRLQSCLPPAEEPLADAPSPPDDLADRTCSLIRSSIDVKSSPKQQAVIAAMSESSESSGQFNCWSNRWSLMNMAVCGGVLVALALLVVPAVRESRDAARRSTCQHKLRSLGTALIEFAEQRHQQLPQVELGENAGIFVVKLAESGILTRQQLANLLVCPDSPLAAEVFAGRIVVHIPTRQELSNAQGARLRELLKHMSGSYAYRIGYWDKQGIYRQQVFSGRGDAPLLADAPSFDVAGFQSANHGGCGQNVLFQDLSIRYCNECVSTQSKDHLFLNANGKPAAGRYRADVVLGRSETEPAGSLAAYARW